jgi:hypothetical protein
MGGQGGHGRELRDRTGMGFFFFLLQLFSLDFVRSRFFTLPLVYLLGMVLVYPLYTPLLHVYLVISAPVIYLVYCLFGALSICLGGRCGGLYCLSLSPLVFILKREMCSFSCGCDEKSIIDIWGKRCGGFILYYHAQCKLVGI